MSFIKLIKINIIRKRFILIITVHFQSRKLKFFVSGTLGLEPLLFAWSRPKLAEAGSEASDFRSRPKSGVSANNGYKNNVSASLRSKSLWKVPADTVLPCRIFSATDFLTATGSSSPSWTHGGDVVVFKLLAAVLWIRIRIGSEFRSFVDPDSYSGSGSTHVNIG